MDFSISSVNFFSKKTRKREEKKEKRDSEQTCKNRKSILNEKEKERKKMGVNFCRDHQFHHSQLIIHGEKRMKIVQKKR